MVSVFWQIKPFWVDEWRIIYNLKFKNSAALWGDLDFMQQFPRVYLELIKSFTQLFNYSYTSLRLPSFLVGTASIGLVWSLMKKFYPKTQPNRFLLVMIFISYCTFTDYYVQVKQYTMDMLLSAVVLHQLIVLLRLSDNMPLNRIRYALLCSGCLICPFFSYSYPIVVMPVFVIVGLNIYQRKRRESLRAIDRITVLQIFPLLLLSLSITAFYFLDVSQLMRDKGMQEFWGHLLMKKGFSSSVFFTNAYNMFAIVGAGLVFQCIFGPLGIASFGYVGFITWKKTITERCELIDWIYLYAATLITSVVVLFAMGVFPLGEPRLSCFVVPSIAILIVGLLDEIRKKQAGERIARNIALVLYLGVIGNIYTTFIAAVSGTEYTKKMNIYRSTENAIVLAQARGLPILITPEVAYPYEKTRNLPFRNNVPGDWVIKTFPAYNVALAIPVYGIRDLTHLREDISHLPISISRVLVGDGRLFRVINR